MQGKIDQDEGISFYHYLKHNSVELLESILEGDSFYIASNYSQARTQYEKVMRSAKEKCLPESNQAVIFILCLTKIANCYLNFTSQDIAKHWSIINEEKLREYEKKFQYERFLIAIKCYCSALAIFEKNRDLILSNDAFNTLDNKAESFPNKCEIFLNKIARIVCQYQSTITAQSIDDQDVESMKHTILGYRAELKHSREIIRLEIAAIDGPFVPHAQVNKGLELSKKISGLFKGLLKKIIDDSLSRMNRDSGKFLAYGIGSMSRDEICPYSDIEFGFLIEDESQKDYFRSLARIIELTIISIGETEFEVMHADDKMKEFSRRNLRPYMYLVKRSATPIGFSIDTAGLQPLGYNGEFELISTSQELFTIVTDMNLLEKYPHLINALKTLCFITGNEPLFLQHYENKLGAQDPEDNHNLALQLIDPVLDKYTPKPTQYQEEERYFDVKKQIYRLPNMAIECLAGFYQIREKDSVSRLNELHRRGLISEDNKNRFLELLNIAILFRIFTHLFYQEETDFVHHKTLESRYQLSDFEKSQVFLISEVNIGDLIYCYRILFPLHRALTHFYSSKGIGDSAFCTQSLLDDEMISKGSFFKSVCKYLEAIELFEKAVVITPDNLTVQIGLVECLSESGNYLRSIERYKKIREHHMPQGDIENQVRVLSGLSHCCLELEKSGSPFVDDPSQLAKSSLEEAKRLCEEKLDKRFNVLYAHVLTQYGVVFKNGDQFFEDAVTILKKIDGNQKYYYLAIIAKERAFHLIRLVKITSTILSSEGLVSWLEEARDKLLEAVEFLRNYYGTSETETFSENYYTPLLLECYRNIASICLQLDDNNAAETYYNKSISICKYLYTNIVHHQILRLYHQLYRWKFSINKTAEGILFAEEAIAIANKLFGGPHIETAKIYKELIEFLLNVGDCVNAHRFCELLINDTTSLKENVLISQAFEMSGHIFMVEKQYGKALEKYKLQLQMFPGINGESDCIRAADAFINLGNVYFILEEYKNAKRNFGNGLQLQLNFKLTLPPLSIGFHDIDFAIPVTMIKYAESYLKLEKFSEASSLFEKAMTRLNSFNLSTQFGFLFIQAARGFRTAFLPLLSDGDEIIRQCRIATENTKKFIDEIVKVKFIDQLDEVNGWLLEDYFYLIQAYKVAKNYNEALEVCELIKKCPDFSKFTSVLDKIDKEIIKINKQQESKCFMM